jgi:hypothetical protein
LNLEKKRKEKKRKEKKIYKNDTIFDLIKIMVATADGIVRASSSPLAKMDREEVSKWTDVYFSNQLHQSLFDFSQFVAGIPLTSS